MLTGLSSLLFGSGGADDAAVDQNRASRPTPLNTQDADNGWVLVDVAENEDRPEADRPVREESLVQDGRDSGGVPGGAGREDDDGEERENQLERRAAGGRENAAQQRAARAARALDLETQQGKVLRAVQRQQRASRAKPLSRRHLDRADKAQQVMSHGRRPASARSRVLRPSGQMNGRQCQRNQ